MGASVLGYDGAAQKLAEFKSRIGCDEGPFYMVKVDVKSCFDMIPQEKLLSVLIHKVLPKVHSILAHVPLESLGRVQCAQV